MSFSHTFLHVVVEFCEICDESIEVGVVIGIGEERGKVNGLLGLRADFGLEEIFWRGV